jgi:hypothetical protein
VNNVSALSGMRLSNTPSRMQTRHVKTLSVLLLGSLLAGCQTTGTLTTVTRSESQCAAWRAITYSSKKDTPMTVQQVRVHNQVGRKLGCWK